MRTTATGGRRTRTERTTGGSNVFSRLTAPTKSAIGKSRRKEDKSAREEWRKTISHQLSEDERNTNMGGFVLKEQRYKKMGARSPLSAKHRSPKSAKHKSRKAATVSKITATNGRNQTSMASHTFSGEL